MLSRTEDLAAAAGQRSPTGSPTTEATGRVPRSERVMLILVVVVLTLVPALVCASHTRSRVQIGLAPAPNTPQAPGAPVSYVRALVRHDLQAHPTALASQSATHLERSFYLTLRVDSAVATGQEGVVITGMSSSPAWALKVLRSEAAKVAATSRQSAALWREVHDVLLPEYGRRLAKHDLSPAVRQRLLAERAFVTAAAGSQPPAGPLEVGRAAVRLQGLRDRILYAMPGDPRPANPIWAAAAGFALAISICFAWVSQFSSRVEKRATARSPDRRAKSA